MLKQLTALALLLLLTSCQWFAAEPGRMGESFEELAQVDLTRPKGDSGLHKWMLSFDTSAWSQPYSPLEASATRGNVAEYRILLYYYLTPGKESFDTVATMERLKEPEWIAGNGQVEALAEVVKGSLFDQSSVDITLPDGRSAKELRAKCEVALKYQIISISDRHPVKVHRFSHIFELRAIVPVR